MNIAIVGYATEGVASAEYWHSLGHEITICDQNEQLAVPDAYRKQLGSDYIKNLDNFDLIVRSAGIHPRILLENNPNIAPKITTNIEEFMRVCPSRNIIGVTGTKGKGTTSTLITKMLQAAGKTTHLGGNIGIAALELLPNIQPDDYVVLEISSFQLEDFKGPSPHIAVCIMVVPEHLNWHADMNEYLHAKGNLFATQNSDDIAVYFAENDNSKAIASRGQAKLIPYFSPPGAVIRDNFVEIDGQKICPVSEIKLLGQHNWQNICAAVTACWQITKDEKALASVIGSFSGLEHRIEFVRELNGVKYYDDSFATTPETSIAAIDAIVQPKILILGGISKGVPLDPIADKVVASNVKHVVAIGEMADTIAEQLKTRGFNNISLGAKNMTDIIAAARSQATDGDAVLLSTGCASYDMFKDYKDRGNQFKTVVQSLA